MAGENNGHYPPNGSGPPVGDGASAQNPDEQAALAAEIDRRIRGVVQQELAVFMAELQKHGVFDRPAPAQAQQTSPVPLSGPFHQTAAPVAPSRLTETLVSLLTDPSKLIALADGVLNVWLRAKQLQNPTMSQIDFLNQIRDTNPQLLSLYSPNPFGSGFQEVMTKALIMGMKVGAYGGVAKKAADHLPNDGWLKEWRDSAEPSAAPAAGPPIPTPLPVGPVPDRPSGAVLGRGGGRRFSDL